MSSRVMRITMDAPSQPLRDHAALDFQDFGIRCLGCAPLASVRVKHDSRWDRWVDSSALPEATRRWKETNWERRLKGLPPLEDNPLFRPMRIEQGKSDLLVYAGKTSYFSNFILQRPASTWVDERVVGAGVSIIPACADGAILLGRRSGIVAVGQGQWHVVGGHIHPDARFECTEVDLTRGALAELEEEMGIDEREVESLAFLGLGIDLTISKPEFLVKAQLKRPSADYIGAWGRLKQAEPEFTEIVPLTSVITGNHDSSRSGDPVAIESILSLQGRVVPACRAALVALWCVEHEAPWPELQGYLANRHP